MDILNFPERPAMAAGFRPLTVAAYSRLWSVTPVWEPVWRPDGSLMALEMLSRLTDRESGVAGEPEAFFARLPDTEQLGVLTWQLDTLARLRLWCGARRTPVSVNITRAVAVRVLADQDMAARIVRLSPWLRLEISEHFLPADGQPERDPLLKGLRSLAPLWLDDFGSGTAGLSALMAGGFEAVKLDRRLFRDIAGLPEGLRFLQAMAGLAAGLGMQIIAEGVENDTLFAAARAAQAGGCQGWRWPAVTADELGRLPRSLPDIAGESPCAG